MDGGMGTLALAQRSEDSLALSTASSVLLDTGPRYAVRRHLLAPGSGLLPCHHLHRTEHWTVVQGTARVTRDGTTQLFSDGQGFGVALGQQHAVENPGRIPLILIEIWTGSYLGDDDVIA